MTTLTAEQFRTARFATHPDGRIAARVDPGDDGYPWVMSVDAEHDWDWYTDSGMAEDGWSPLDESPLDESPLDESPPSAVSEFTITGKAARDPEAIVRAVRKMLDKRNAAPATDEDDPSVDYHAMWWKAESALEDLREQYGTVVREKDEWEANEQEQAVRADEAEAFAALWKETARRLAHDRRFIGRVANTAAERLDEAWARAEKAEWERDNARYSRDLWVEKAEKAEQEREGLRVALEKATVERNRAELRVEDLESMTAREHLAAAWSAAHVPADGTIPAGALYIESYGDGSMYGPLSAGSDMQEIFGDRERRLLDPPTPARPDGAEEIEVALYNALPSARLDEDEITDLADALAERGVRVTGAES